MPQLRVAGCFVDEGGLVVRVRPTWTKPRCSGCGRALPHRARGALATRDRRWRHLDLAGCQLELSYDTHWVHCDECGRVVEAVPWSSDSMARCTDEFDRQVAFLTQRCDKTAVTRLMRISWRTVGRCVEREVRRQRPGDPLLGLRVIGVDELSYRKHHHYVTVVTDLTQRRFVWGKDGKAAKSFVAFFDALGTERCKQIEVVCMDMSAAYLKPSRESAGQRGRPARTYALLGPQGPVAPRSRSNAAPGSRSNVAAAGRRPRGDRRPARRAHRTSCWRTVVCHQPGCGCSMFRTVVCHQPGCGCSGQWFVINQGVDVQGVDVLTMTAAICLAPSVAASLPNYPVPLPLERSFLPGTPHRHL